MIGPSSSHTAGACRIGNMARLILDDEPKEFIIQFSGSFKNTYIGHGTDKAVIAGLMGYGLDDINIRNSLEIAKLKNIKYEIVCEDIEMAHPNTVLIKMKKNNGDYVTVVGSSIGGGNIVITQIDNAKVNLNGLYETIIVGHKDKPGMIYKITSILNDKQVNINSIYLSRTEKSGNAIVIIELDDKIDNSSIESIRKIENVSYATLIPILE